ncbi:MAG: hypothetical protein OXG09_01770 [Chloroflexi bacterium]|nr:hypothetical protein [Chloroflexota bacterium]
METTVIIAIGVVISLFAYLEMSRRDLRSEIREVRHEIRDVHHETRDVRHEIRDVRQASETAHTNILTELGNIKEQQGVHTGRFDGINQRFDDIKDFITTAKVDD